jgi:hypothetical protein
MKLTTLDIVALILVIIGGLNWGLIAISPTYNVVEMIFGSMQWLVMIIYALVGLSAIYMAVMFPKLERK